MRSGHNLNRNVVKFVSGSPRILLLMHVTVIYYYKQTLETNI